MVLHWKDDKILQLPKLQNNSINPSNRSIKTTECETMKEHLCFGCRDSLTKTQGLCWPDCAPTINVDGHIETFCSNDCIQRFIEEIENGV